MLLKKFIFIEIYLGIIIYFCVIILKENIEFFFYCVLYRKCFLFKIDFFGKFIGKKYFMFCMKYLFV